MRLDFDDTPKGTDMEIKDGQPRPRRWHDDLFDSLASWSGGNLHEDDRTYLRESGKIKDLLDEVSVNSKEARLTANGNFTLSTHPSSAYPF